MAVAACHYRCSNFHRGSILVSSRLECWKRARSNIPFRFSWTGFTSSIHWLAPTASGVLIGFGILCIFLPCFNYLVDSYLPL